MAARRYQGGCGRGGGSSSSRGRDLACRCGVGRGSPRREQRGEEGAGVPGVGPLERLTASVAGRVIGPEHGSDGAALRVLVAWAQAGMCAAGAGWVWPSRAVRLSKLGAPGARSGAGGSRPPPTPEARQVPIRGAIPPAASYGVAATSPAGVASRPACRLVPALRGPGCPPPYVGAMWAGMLPRRCGPHCSTVGAGVKRSLRGSYRRATSGGSCRGPLAAAGSLCGSTSRRRRGGPASAG